MARAVDVMTNKPLIAFLRGGCMLHAKRWCGDTHSDLGGSIDEVGTDKLMAKGADEIERLDAIVAKLPKWRKEPPDASEWWWHWSGNEDSAPVPVYVTNSGFGDSYFATAGQLGWTQAQTVGDMGGWWMRLSEPELPTIAAAAAGGE